MTSEGVQSPQEMDFGGPLYLTAYLLWSPPLLLDRMCRVLRKIPVVLEMIKVQHSLFALPWAFVAAFYAAGGLPPWGKLGWVLLAMVAARCAAMAFNRAVDARYDAENPRTRM